MSEAIPFNTSTSLGAFEIQCATEPGASHLRLIWKERVIWEGPEGGALLEAYDLELHAKESRGFFKMEEKEVRSAWRQCELQGWDASSEGVILKGSLTGSSTLQWQMTFKLVDHEQLAFEVSFEGNENVKPNCIVLNWAMAPSEKIFGLGTQFTHVDLRWKKVPVLSQEPGIGRGVQPLTWLMNTFFGAGGSTILSNAPSSHLMTSEMRSLALENKQYAVYDFTQSDRMGLKVYAPGVKGRFFFGETPLDLMEVATRFIGRMPPLPRWLQQGAVIGMQGGRALVERRLERLRMHGAALAAFWLQDWVGGRKTAAGHQLWWNWEVDDETYPQWPEFVGKLKSLGVRVMAYVNPFLVNVASKKTVKHNYYQEAKKKGFLIKNPRGEDYTILNTSFSAGLLDLSNPDARAFIKDIIRKELLSVGVSGWMADFGEALPFDAVLHGEVSAADYHNRYPEVWAQINREVIAESGLEGEVTFFMRSGFTQAPTHATLFWLGDQLTGWRAEDGIKNAVTGLLSSGMSGFSLNHSDIGGYIATTLPHVPFPLSSVGHSRSRELLWRWIELNAFTAVFRTHEGNQPRQHYQVFDDEETLAHFSRFSRVYAALSDYRQSLCEEASQKGWPLVRHPWLHYPDNETLRDLEYQMMLGPDIMVAPVLEPKQRVQRVFLPAENWIHLWTGQTYEMAPEGNWIEIDAPLGCPPVFLRSADGRVDRIIEKMKKNNALSDGERLGGDLPLV